jgi:hypothetical protein
LSLAFDAARARRKPPMLRYCNETLISSDASVVPAVAPFGQYIPHKNKALKKRNRG